MHFKWDLTFSFGLYQFIEYLFVRRNFRSSKKLSETDLHNILKTKYCAKQPQNQKF